MASSNSGTTPFTVGDYLAERLYQIGVKHHFVVPGDYNLILLDKLQAHPELTEIGCTNELNCSMAAEGNARAAGVSACIVTFTVGALSAFNGTASAYAENLPLILISGSPNTNDVKDFNILHHTLGEYDNTYQLQMAKKITVAAVAVGRAYDAPRLIDHALRKAITLKKPSYIEIPTNVADAECVRPGPLSTLIDTQPSNVTSLDAAVESAAEYLRGKKKPVILVGPLVGRAGVQKETLELVEAMGCAVAVQPSAKGFFPEDHKQYCGTFWGQVSTLDADVIVNWADAIICIGTVFSDYTTVGWTAMPSVPLLTLFLHGVSYPGGMFGRVNLKDMLIGLSKSINHNEKSLVEYNRFRPDTVSVHVAESEELLTRKETMRQVQEILTPQTTVFVETGDAWFNGIGLKLPSGAKFEIEMQYGHIGWSVPAILGYGLSERKRKMVLIIGDGSFQVTVQEVSQMIRHKLPIIIILMNNRGYTIETEIHDGSYNHIKNWNYALLMKAFNAEDGKGQGFLANKAGELAIALERAHSNQEGPTLIECTIDQDDCTKELITWGHYVAAANARR